MKTHSYALLAVMVLTIAYIGLPAPAKADHVAGHNAPKPVSKLELQAALEALTLRVAELEALSTAMRQTLA